MNFSKFHLVHFVLAMYFWVLGLPLKVVYITSKTLLEKTKFLSGNQLEIASGLVTESVSYLLSTQGPYLVQGYEEFICVSVVLFPEGLATLVFTISTGTYSCLASYDSGFPEH